MKMQKERVRVRHVLAVVLFALASFAIAAVGLSGYFKEVTPQQELKEVQGKVSYSSKKLIVPSGEGADHVVEARLTGYDSTFKFYYPPEKLDDVYSGLRVGADAVLLVEESEGRFYIWGVQSNGIAFLSYETTANWHRSNKRWWLGLALFFGLAGGGIIVWAFAANRNPLT
jgi:hypothetical protein